MLRKTWYVSCSPRNPEKLAPELELFSTLKGKKWNKTVNGKKVTQLEFCSLLETCPTFEGSISKKEPAFSARDRVKPYKTFGFAYVNTKGEIVITKAGERLIAGKRPKELFLKQLLKWQYPSYQHHGKQYEFTDSSLLTFMGIRIKQKRGFYTLPFVDTLAVTRKIGGISKTEIAMFMLPKTRIGSVNDTLKMIGKFREKLSKIRGRVPRRKFKMKHHFRIYKHLYKDEIKGMKKKETEKFVWKKVRNSLDVADATIRHFRYTGILTIEKGYLSIPKSRMKDVAAILSMKLKPVKFYRDVEKFYEYMGDPNIPVLPYESTKELIRRILQTRKHVLRLKKKHKSLSLVTIPILPPSSKLRSLSISEVKDILESVERTKLNMENIVLVEKMKLLDRKQIIEMYTKILAKDEEIFDPPVYFEWNTYRAMIAIDNATVVPNFKMDESHQPISHAPGNCPDIIAEFPDFVVVIEVTLKTGKRQYHDEGEPVIDHVGEYQKDELEESSPRRVFGLFIAPKIKPNTTNYFYLSSKIDMPEYGGSVTVFSLTLDEFLDIVKFSGEVGALQHEEILDLFERFESARENAKNPSSWRTLMKKSIHEWKKDMLSAKSS